MQTALFYRRDLGAYEPGAKTQISCYVNDKDYTQPVFIGVVNINLSQIVNKSRDSKGKVTPQELEIELDRCDYEDTSMKIVISAKKNFKFSKADKMQEIKASSKKKAETNDGTFYMISNDDIDNLKEKYMDSEDDDDEFFRGYSQAKEFSQVRDTLQTDRDTQDMRNKLIMEDFAPGFNKPSNNLK